MFHLFFWWQRFQLWTNGQPFLESLVLLFWILGWLVFRWIVTFQWMVSQPCTNLDHSCLTAVIGREVIKSFHWWFIYIFFLIKFQCVFVRSKTFLLDDESKHMRERLSPRLPARLYVQYIRMILLFVDCLFIKLSSHNRWFQGNHGNRLSSLHL